MTKRITDSDSIKNGESLKAAKSRYDTEIPIYDDGFGPLFISRCSIGINGIVRAQTWEDAYEICEDEFFPEADESVEELVEEYGYKHDDMKLIRRTVGGTCEYKFAEFEDYPLDAHGWAFVAWCELLTLDRDAWMENALFEEAYGFRPNGPNVRDKQNHGIYAKDLNGDYLDRLTPKLLKELEITLEIEGEEDEVGNE